MASKFPQRKIGETSVSALGLGCMSFSIPLSTGIPDEDECLKVLTAAADMGINVWVTSDMYGPFTNEAILGRWFRETGRRDEIFLVSKFGVKLANDKMEVDGTPAYVKAACEASLKRLETDRIDLYMAHRIDSSTPIEKTVGAMLELKKGGKIKYLGLSECSTATLNRAHKVHPIAAVEMEYSPLALDIEDPKTSFLAAARELGVKILCYSPLGRGFFTGAIKSRDDFDEADRRKMHPRFSEENFGSNLKMVEGFVDVAKEKGCSPGQLALAWILAQGDGKFPAVLNFACADASLQISSQYLVLNMSNT